MLIVITLTILTASLVLGGISSYLVLNTSIFGEKRVQKFRYKANVFKEHFPLTAFNIVCLYLISGVSLYFLQGIFSFEVPSLAKFVLQVLLFLFIDDTYMYFYHRALHESTFLFTKIHKIHHKACPPFPLDFMYVHPLEWMLGTVGMTLGLITIYLIWGEVNVYTFWLASGFRNFHEVIIHSGVRSAFAHYIPFMGTTEDHDYHHSKLNGNYSSSFTFWDKIFKTNITPKQK
ncbi:MAG: sterol desaturase family protein [Bacteroidia bacterium]